MLNDTIVAKIKEFSNNENVYYAFVEDEEVDKTQTYITYDRVSATPDHERFICVSVFDINVFSTTLETAINTRNILSWRFALTENEDEILETRIEDEKELFDEEHKMHHAILSIRIMHIIKNNLGE